MWCCVGKNLKYEKQVLFSIWHIKVFKLLCPGWFCVLKCLDQRQNLRKSSWRKNNSQHQHNISCPDDLMSSSWLNIVTRNKKWSREEQTHFLSESKNHCYQITPAASTPPNAWCRFLTLNNSKKLRSCNLGQKFLYFKMLHFPRDRNNQIQGAKDGFINFFYNSVRALILRHKLVYMTQSSSLWLTSLNCSNNTLSALSVILRRRRCLKYFFLFLMNCNMQH